MENYCTSCPRHCKTNRVSNVGFCEAKNECIVAKVMLHHWEEPVISGDENSAGSGAIFFSHCNLKCVYCQNFEISHFETGEKYSPVTLAELFKKLEKQGALNINLVTPTHYAFEILEALQIYKPKIPIVWNTGGFESCEIVEKLKNYVDIFLTDFKYYSNELSSKYSSCPNYFENCSKSLLKMREIVPEDIIQNGLMKKGIIVRHMILPGCTSDSIQILNWIKENLGTKTCISLMSQYTPCGNAKNFPEINRKLKPIEYKIVKNHLLKLGLENGFLQNLSSANTCFIPNFDEK